MNTKGYIYKITNLINGKIYIGQTRYSIEKRWKQHINDSKRNDCRANYPLYRAIRKYGIENFKIEQIEQCDISNLNEREIYWIKQYDSYHNGYNLTLGGFGKKRLELDENKVVEVYKNIKNLSKVSKLFNCSNDTIMNILHKHNIDIISAREHSKNDCKDVLQYDENNNLVNVFRSFTEVGEWLIEKKYQMLKML